MPDVLCEQRDGVAVVTLNRPDRRNALSAALLAELRATVARLDASPDVRAIVLTGADPAFCAGLDLTELGEPGSALGGAGSGPVLPPLSTVLIGAVNGAAVSGGLELALACDFLIASEHARFADTHARVGIMPGWGLSYALPEAVGLRRARHDDREWARRPATAPGSDPTHEAPWRCGFRGDPCEPAELARHCAVDDPQHRR